MISDLSFIDRNTKYTQKFHNKFTMKLIEELFPVWTEFGCLKHVFRSVVLNVWSLATHKTEYYTIWRPIYFIHSTTTQILATQK